MSARAVRQIGYIELLRTNPDFRRLFIGQLVSQTGDWFNSVALFTLLLELTGSSEAVGLVLIIKLLPTFFAGPLAGVVADRFNRKTIMILADLICGVVVLGFLAVTDPGQVWLVYVLAAAEILTASFFDTAKSAAIPGIVPQEGLIAANGLSTASWSVTLALGAALGGLVTAFFGRQAAFVINSISYFVSAAFIASVRMRRRSAPAASVEQRRVAGPGQRVLKAARAGIREFVEGTRYLRRNTPVASLLLVKSGWGLGGGVLLLLTVFGKQIFPIGPEGSVSIGLFFAARGTGALIGPLIASRITAGSPEIMKRVIATAFGLSALFYLLVAVSPSFPVAMLCVVGAHAGGSIQWVFSSTLIQMTADDRFLGRVFALDMALVTLTMSISTWFTGFGLDHAGLDPRAMASLLGAVFVLPGFAWFLLQRRLAKVDSASHRLAPTEPSETAESGVTRTAD
jgi:MFS family permease